MNRFLTAILLSALSLSSIATIAATTSDNKDDSSAIGTSDSPRVVRQRMLLQQ